MPDLRAVPVLMARIGPGLDLRLPLVDSDRQRSFARSKNGR